MRGCSLCSVRALALRSDYCNLGHELVVYGGVREGEREREREREREI